MEFTRSVDEGEFIRRPRGCRVRLDTPHRPPRRSTPRRMIAARTGKSYPVRMARIVRFVNALAMVKLVMELLSKSRLLKLRANSNPATLLILLPPALKELKLSR